MNKYLFTQRQLDKLHQPPRSSIYSHRLFQDIATGYSVTLGKRADKADFYSFSPPKCDLEVLLKSAYGFNLGNSIEHIIDSIVYSLLVNDKAYVRIKPVYNLTNDTNSSEPKTLNRLELEEIKGFLLKKTNDNIMFCTGTIDGKAKEIRVSAKELISFDIKEVGYSRKYFVNLVNKLSKYDITATPFISSHNADGYDFSVHSNVSRLKVLELTKSIGWLFGNDELSDSYILYRKIVLDKTKKSFLDYVVNRINQGIADFMNISNAGIIVTNTRDIDYDRVWKEYSEGKITVNELSKILYQI